MNTWTILADLLSLHGAAALFCAAVVHGWRAAGGDEP